MTIKEKTERELPLHIEFSAYAIAQKVFPQLNRKHPKGHMINTGEGDVIKILSKLDYVEDLGNGFYWVAKHNSYDTK
jgi:DNA-directed RNA polymerase subunit H (RpoH/RPB5)|tara:strand:+ start:1476 stop:1706 length:231 start_codon:yes stop_codon:yes gene_type:complete